METIATLNNDYFTLEVLILKNFDDKMCWQGFVSYANWPSGGSKLTTSLPFEGERFTNKEVVVDIIEKLKDCKQVKAFKIHKTTVQEIEL